MKVLIDTCIIIDTLQQRKPFCKYSNTIFLAVANRLIEGFITAKSISDIYYLTHKSTHSEEKTREILNKLFSLFDVFDTTATDCINALSSETKDYEDAIMIETAKREKVDVIVTRNLIDFSKSPIKVLSPEELLTIIEAE